MAKVLVLDQLIRLIKSLDNAELAELKRHLRFIKLNSKKKINQVQQLIDLIALKNVFTYPELVKIVTPNGTSYSFNKVAKKAVDYILELLVSENLMAKKYSIRDSFREQLLIKRELLKVLNLSFRGHDETVKRLLKPIVIRASKFELYNELLEALYILQEFSLTDDPTKFDKLSREIKFYEDCRTKLFKAKMLYRQYGNLSISKASLESVSLYNSKAIRDLNSDFKSTKSANIKCYYYLLKLEMSYREQDFVKEFKVAKELLDLLKSSPAVYSKGRISLIYTNLTNTADASCQFKLSNTLARNSIYWSSFEVNLNQIYSYRGLIKSLIFLNKNHEAINQIDKLIKNKFIDQYPYFNTYFKYLKAVSSFLLLDFNLSNKTLHNLKELEKDKEGWNIWIQVLRIQVYLEMQRFSESEYLIENLRKYLERNREKYQIKERLFLISKLFIELKTCNFDYKKAAKKKSDVLNKLKSLDKDCRWDGRTPEMILFHDWFESKKDNRPYKANFEPYRIDLKVDEAEFESVS
ncbi:MAG: hypothetical protein RJQ00_04155 [Vicingaceae bacterium]